MISDFKIFKHDIIKASLFVLIRTCGDLHFGYVLKLKDILFKYKIIYLQESSSSSSNKLNFQTRQYYWSLDKDLIQTVKDSLMM